MADLSPYGTMAIEGGAADARPVATSDVLTAEWVRLRCQYGCGMYGRCRTCPPHSPTPDLTRRVLDEFETGLLIRSHDQAGLRSLAADIERQAYLDGYYKAFGLHAGPCTLCEMCETDEPCKHPSRARPAMEAAGIDVLATARRAGMPVDVLVDRDEIGDYYALVLFE